LHPGQYLYKEHFSTTFIAVSICIMLLAAFSYNFHSHSKSHWHFPRYWSSLLLIAFIAGYRIGDTFLKDNFHRRNPSHCTYPYKNLLKQKLQKLPSIQISKQHFLQDLTHILIPLQILIRLYNGHNTIKTFLSIHDTD